MGGFQLADVGQFISKIMTVKVYRKKTLKNKFCSVQLITSIVASSPTVTLKIEANISYLTHIIIWGNSIVEIILVNKFEGSQA